MKKRISLLIGLSMLINAVVPANVFAAAQEPVAAPEVSEETVAGDEADPGYDYEGVMEYVHEALVSQNETINLAEFEIPYPGDGINQIFSDAKNLFSDTYSFKGTQDGKLHFTITTREDDTKYVKELPGLAYYEYDSSLFDSAVELALENVDPELSDVGVLAYLHDYLVQRCEVSYDYEDENISNAYGALVNHSADVEGFAKGLAVLYKEAGFDSEVVHTTGAAVDESVYSYYWTRVKLGEKYYNVDAYHDAVFTDQVRHNYFLLSDQTMVGTLAQTESVKFTSQLRSFLPAAESTEYDDAFWRAENVITPLVFEEDNIYYGFYSRKDENNPYYVYLYKADVKDPANQGSAFYDLPTNSDYRLKNFCGLFLLEDRLYFNNKMFIYSIDLNAQNRNKVYMREEGAPDIYFCYYLDKAPGYLDEKGAAHPVVFRTDLVDDGSDDKDQEIKVVEDDEDQSGDDKDNEDDAMKPTSTELTMTDGNATMIKGTVIGVNKFISDNSITMFTVDCDKKFIQYNPKTQTLKFKKETGAMGPTYLVINGERFSITIIKPLYVKGTNKATLLLSSGLAGCDECLIKMPNSDDISWGTIKYLITPSAGCSYDFNSEEKKLEGVWLDGKTKGTLKITVMCFYIDPVKNVEKKVKLGTFKVKVID